MAVLFSSKQEMEAVADDFVRLAMLTDEEVSAETGTPLSEVWRLRNWADTLREKVEWDRIAALPLERRKAEINRKRAILESHRLVVDHMQTAADAEEAELAHALDAYTTPGNPEYDPEFDAHIRALRPDWFEGGGES
jgi:hypothetical protein